MSSVAEQRRNHESGSLAVTEDLVLFHRMLAEMCRSRVPLPKAMRLLSRDLQRSPLRQAAMQMAVDIEAGLSLEEAYERQGNQLPSLYRSLVQVGTASGDLPAVLDQISRHASDRAHIATRLRRAMFYPMVSAVGVSLVALIMVVYLGPRIESAAGATPLPFGFAPTAGFWWAMAPWLVLATFVLAVVMVFVLAWVRNPLDGGAGPKGLRFRLPFVGQLRGFAVKSGFAATMAMLIERGMPLPHSLRLVAASTDDREVATQIGAMCVRAEDGSGLAEAVGAGELMSPAMMWFVEAGEASGAPATALEDVARIYRDRLDRGVDRMCFMVGPLGLLLTGLVVLWFAVTYLAPIFEGFRSVY